MVPFFIFLSILILSITIYLSTFEIEVKNIDFDSEKNLNNFLIYIRLKLIDKFTWAKIKIDNKGFDKYRNINNKFLKKISIDLKKSLKNIWKIKELDFVLKKVNLKIKICLIDPIITSLSVVLISTVLSIIFGKYLGINQKEKCIYTIKPIFNSKVDVKLFLNCIISIKLVHIINTMYKLVKKGSVINGKKSSNRRSYASCNE